MQRREILRVLAGSAASAVLAPLSPSDRLTLGASLHAETRAGTALDRSQLALVSELAETILPRTGTPGALDAGVPAFIDRMVAWWDTAEERDRFLRGLGEIGTRLAGTTTRDQVLSALDSATLPGPASAEEAWVRLKSMTVYGYFTSKLVQENVLHTVIVPGRFAGCVPTGG
jgi:hypothetical protein